MTSVMSHAHAGSSAATDKQLLDAFTLGGGDRGDGGFGVEEAGMGGSSGVGGFFLSEGDNELMLQHIQAALVGASAAAGNSSLSSSGATTALASSSASSDSGADAHGDDKDACKWTVGVCWTYLDIVLCTGACLVDWPGPSRGGSARGRGP